MSKIKTLSKAEKFNNALNKKNISLEIDTNKHIDDTLETKKSKDETKKDVRTKELEYKKLELRDQILLRPDTYIGSVKKNKSLEPIWIFRNKKIIQDNVSYTEGFIRLFIEVISNAIDNVWRSNEFKIPMKFIKINIDYTNNIFSVCNDGKCIPLTIQPNENIYIPEMIFGNLLTSSNYNDNEERKTSGKNGFGSKVSNIFSTEFSIECFNPKDNMIYSQKWNNNMSIKSDPILNKNKSDFPKSIDEGKNGYTKVTWKPDLIRFDMKVIDKDTISIIEKYIIDCAMTVCKYGVKVIYNGNEIIMKDYKDYIKFYFPDLGDEYMFLNGEDSCAAICPANEFTQVSFVNGIHTKDGGVHVDAWCEQLFRPLVNKLNGIKEEKEDKEEKKKDKEKKKKEDKKKKEKNMNIDIRDIKKHFFIFIYSSLDKPSFDSQNKTRLNSPVPKVEIKSQVISKLIKWKFIEYLKESQKLKEMINLKGETERKRGIKRVEGLDDANFAGKSGKNLDCILTITEGLSAKTYVVQGMKYGLLGKSGHDYIGILPVRGKFINARNASVNSLTKNKEVRSVIQALGLQHGIDYSLDENKKKLRYGKLLLFVDSDEDGLHICGLIYNFFSTLFPSLLKIKDFIGYVRTPIIKVQKGNNKIGFYYKKEAKEYIEKNNIKKDHIRYFKGLGTSNADDVKNDFGKRIVSLVNEKEGEDLLNNVFHKDTADFRKQWLTSYDPLKNNIEELKDLETEKNGNSVIEKVKLVDFLNKEFIHFSIDDCKRSIPCILDGLKESHRKVLYAAFKRNLRFNGQSLKVAQFAGYVAECSNYHHGEQNLYDTITKLAQRFVGSNNVPLLFNDGAFGERLENGKDAANGRYIFTKLDMLTRYIFKEEDEHFLTNREDDGDIIEKNYYLPIIPMILINGVNVGIGTGFSCSVPSYNIKDIIEWIKLWIEDKQNLDSNKNEITINVKPVLKPWYRNFKGSIYENGKKIITKGLLEKQGNSYVITELPIGKKNLSISKYKQKLEELQEKNIIKSIRDLSNENDIKFIITLSPDIDDKMQEEQLYDVLNLTDCLYTSNMVLFDKNGILKKYDNVNDIITEFCIERLNLYTIRKNGIIASMEYDLKYLKNKLRFVTEVVNKTIVLNDKTDELLFELLKNRNFDLKEDTYDYLLSMQMRSMTKTKIELLQKEINDLIKKLENYKNTTIYDIWKNELNELYTKYQEWLKLN